MLTEAAAMLAPWKGAYGGVPPFDVAKPDAIEAAYIAAIAIKRREIEAIASNSEPTTFHNTVERLEDSGRALARVETLFRVFTATEMDPAMSAAQARLAPLRPALEDWIAHHDRLFARITTVTRQRGLDPHQRRLTEVVHARMTRRGAGLAASQRAQLAGINQELATLEARFQQQMQVDCEEQFAAIEQEVELDGLDAGLRQTLRSEARRRGLEVEHAVPNTRGMFDAVMASAASRALRERVWRMWTARGAASNAPVADAILRLRGAKARLLGYAHYADYATADRMAGTATRARALEESIARRALPVAEAHTIQIAALASAEGFAEPLEPWDREYYSERLRGRTYGFDSASLTPYLRLDRMMAGMFWAAERLYGFTFRQVEDVPVLHPEITVYEVARGGAAVGLLYTDLFLRPGKRGTAWMDEYRTAEDFRTRVPVLASLNHCLQASVPGELTLLSWDNARVLFHEMGHALHALSTDVRYPSLGIMNVAWDMIELPSQLFEHLITTPEILRRFARHHETGAPMPDALIASVAAGATFDAGAWALVQSACALVDLELHIAADGSHVDSLAIERMALADLPMPHTLAPRHQVPHFAHIFVADAYAAGYYCYHWADVMSADAIDAFASSPGGMFDAAVAGRFHAALLSVGDSVPAEAAYHAFAGRDPDPDALIRKLDLAA